ncbi:hypothetical protein ACFLR8_00765 [Bacteroidota bacterium]
MKPLIHIKDPEEASGFYDKCIAASPNGLIYALSWYLNIVCPEWEVLATEDHSTVMPLPISRSLGRKVLKQPEYAYQLGVFSTSILSPEVIQHFISAIPEGYRLRKLCMSKFNIVPTAGVRFLNTAELDLISPYKMIVSKFGSSMKNSLKLAQEKSLIYVNNVSVHDMLMFAYRLDRFNRKRLKPHEISMLRMIASNAIRYRSAQIGAAYDSHNNLCATVIFLIYKGKASILHAAASSEGIAARGIEFIIDRFIESKAEENMVLCVDNPSDKQLMDILKSCGSGISNFPCIRQLG